MARGGNHQGANGWGEEVIARTYVYFIMGDSPNPYVYAVKIGVSSNPEKRLAALQTANPGRLWIQSTVECDSREAAMALEKRLHKALRVNRIGGEWFYNCRQLDPYTRPDSVAPELRQ